MRPICNWQAWYFNHFDSICQVSLSHFLLGFNLSVWSCDSAAGSGRWGDRVRLPPDRWPEPRGAGGHRLQPVPAVAPPRQEDCTQPAPGNRSPTRKRKKSCGSGFIESGSGSSISSESWSGSNPDPRFYDQKVKKTKYSTKFFLTFFW